MIDERNVLLLLTELRVPQGWEIVLQVTTTKLPISARVHALLSRMFSDKLTDLFLKGKKRLMKECSF